VSFFDNILKTVINTMSRQHFYVYDPHAFNWHHLIWPWMTVRGRRLRSYFLTGKVQNGKGYNVGPNRDYRECP